jgi:hypothetical protein
MPVSRKPHFRTNISFGGDRDIRKRKRSWHNALEETGRDILKAMVRENVAVGWHSVPLGFIVDAGKCLRIH